VFIKPHLDLSSKQRQNNKVSEREQYIYGVFIIVLFLRNMASDFFLFFFICIRYANLDRLIEL